MLRGILILVIVLVLSKPIIWVCRRFAYWGRKKWSDDEVRCVFGGGQDVMEALSLLSKFYAVPIGFLRPEDVFAKEGRLWKYDSWTFNSGQDRLNDFVWAHGLHGEYPDWTILDFVNWYVKDVYIEKNGESEYVPQ